jgi:hypothetical protein
LGVKYVVWLLMLPLRLFDAIAGYFVEPPVEQELSRAELLANRNVLMEEMERPQAGGMGGP